MDDEKEIILELLHEILGDEKRHYESHGQITYNCKECDDGKNKGNLEVNYIKHVWKCWSCCDINDTYGSLHKLIDRYGTKKHKKIYKLLQPEVQDVKQKAKPKIKLPQSFVLFKDSSSVYPVRQQAYNYLKSRGITDEIIDKYSIGFCDNGEYMGRIIIPSYDSEGQLNYFIARSWNPKTKSKYKNPKFEKDKIIFNESLINWNENITLVEGAFDAVFVPNSIAMLGKHLSELLFQTLYKKAKKNIIIATDGDAFEDGVKIYNELNGGELYGRIEIVKLPIDKDICDVKGKIEEYKIKMR